MDFSIASILMLDGATNGAIYALLALALVLVFAVTRVIFIPQGEFVAYGALTLALLQTGVVPGQPERLHQDLRHQQGSAHEPRRHQAGPEPQDPEPQLSDRAASWPPVSAAIFVFRRDPTNHGLRGA